MNRIDIYYICVSAVLILSSCEHKELCFNHSEHAMRYASRIEADYDLRWEVPWEMQTDWQSDWSDLDLGFGYDELVPSSPEGLRLSAYDEAGKHTVLNMKPAGEEVMLSPGENQLIFYNNDTEYIVFSDMGRYVTAKATTRTRTRSSYTGNPLYSKDDEPTLAPPDVLFGHYIDSYYQERSTDSKIVGITMRPLVFTYIVRYYFKHGLNYVALARGALSGMAASVSLSDGRTLAETATLLYDCTVEPWGVQAVVKSFGIPDFPSPNYSRDERSYGLNLEVCLHNGKIFSFYFDISTQMAMQPHGGVITVGDIEIKDEDGSSGGSAFDVEVNDWGEFQDIEVEF